MPALFAAAVLYAQDAAAPLSFEVASVKPAVPSAANKRGGVTVDPGRITYSMVALGALIEQAYGVKSYQVTGPEWIKTERYDIAATLPQGSSENEVPAMLRTLLAERFRLALHREQKVLPVYEMTAGKGLKAKPSGRSAEGIRLSLNGNGMKLTGTAGLSSLAAALSNMVDRPVLDLTGAQGLYDFDLEWVPDERDANSGVGRKFAARNGGEGKAPEGGDSPGGPSLFTVLGDSLGLKLEPKKVPVETIVIDHAEKVPTEN